MSKGSPISPSLMAAKSAGATKAPEKIDRTADTVVDAAAPLSPVLGPNNVVPPTVMTGSQAIVRSLEELGVDDIFGLPGGAILPTYDPLMASSMNHVLVRHEQGAGHAAQGYAMVTGRVGVCIATSGPGATNLVTAIMDAHMDSVPLVAITGQVSSGVIGTDAFQEADIVGITMPITKHSFLVTDPNDIPHVMAEAFHLASTGRPGPVLVDVAKDAQVGQMTFSWPPKIDLPGYRFRRVNEIFGYHLRRTHDPREAAAQVRAGVVLRLLSSRAVKRSRRKSAASRLGARMSIRSGSTPSRRARTTAASTRTVDFPVPGAPGTSTGPEPWATSTAACWSAVSEGDAV